jgi:myo-inositol-1(or 4)-monophosphatase
MTNWKNILNFTQVTCEEVGKQLLQDFGQVQADSKADGTLVTKADKWADATIIAAISKNFPEHGILSEEGVKVLPDTEWCWVVDPLDGTTNFTRGIPIWGISIGLLYRGVPVFGYVAVPTLNENFYGFWGGDSGLEIPQGAFRNNKPIHASKDAPSQHHFFNVCSRSTAIIQPDFPCKVRMLGVASYNFLTVATGAVLGGIEATPKIWDIAAAWVIVKAAGGTWLGLNREPFPVTIGVDYSDVCFATLVLGNKGLEEVFRKIINS